MQLFCNIVFLQNDISSNLGFTYLARINYYLATHFILNSVEISHLSDLFCCYDVMVKNSLWIFQRSIPSKNKLSFFTEALFPNIFCSFGSVHIVKLFLVFQLPNNHVLMTQMFITHFVVSDKLFPDFAICILSWIFSH